MDGPLFVTGKFSLHSGEESDFKIECNALLEHDIETCARLIARRAGTFIEAIGVPRGGLKLAEELNKYSNPRGPAPFLVVDDVLTSGGSILEMMSKVGPGAKGYVIFNRGPCPEGVKSLFTFND